MEQNLQVSCSGQSAALFLQDHQIQVPDCIPYLDICPIIEASNVYLLTQVANLRLDLHFLCTHFPTSLYGLLFDSYHDCIPYLDTCPIIEASNVYLLTQVVNLRLDSHFLCTHFPTSLYGLLFDSYHDRLYGHNHRYVTTVCGNS